MNEEFLNPDESPLTEEERKTFEGHAFFTVDMKYRLSAKFVRTEKEKPFNMATTIPRKATYKKYGEAYFELDGRAFKLSLFQRLDLKTNKYVDHLFLPFTDLTSGEESYGGGRFIDLTIPEGDTILIDFNKAYNPYCAYSHRYSCPIPPQENKLDIRIMAGVALTVHEH